MNKIILVIALLSISFFAIKAQEPQKNYVLQSSENSAKTYIARDFISLKSGFSFKASNGNTFLAKINPCLLFPPTEGVYKSENGEISEYKYGGGLVGTISGNFNVNPLGAANYEIPLKKVPGTGGMAPDLSILYNSMGGKGILGFGFQLSGLSSITRIGLNYHNDGTVNGINFITDKFALDGNRLIAVSGKYGANGTEYRTENNTFEKVISYGTVSGDPQKFIVYTKDGLIKEYGYTADSRVEAQNKTEVLTWQLNKVTDTKGNYFTVTYEENNSEGYCIPLRIDYTGNKNTGLSPYASYQFVYDQGVFENQVSYIAGSRQVQKKKLTNIRNYLGEHKIWEYEFRYDPTQGYSSTRIDWVTLYNKDGEKFNPIRFEYEKSTVSLPNIPISNFSNTNLFGVKSAVYTGDFNGDGVTDVVSTADRWEAKTTWKGLKYFTGNATNGTMDFVYIDDLNDVGCYENGYDLRELKIGDFNGDGKSDILVIYFKYNTPNNAYYRVLLSNGNNFVLANEFSIDLEPGNVSRPDPNLIKGKPMLGDYNGDGLTDICFVNIYGSNKTVQVYYSTGSSFRASYRITMARSFDTSDFGDFNGDGRLDILFRYEKGYEIKTFKSEIMSTMKTGSWPNQKVRLVFGDFNGDKLTDFVALGDQKQDIMQWSVNLSTGDGFERNYFRRMKDPTKDQVYVGDFNSDGRSDLLFAADKKIGGNWKGLKIYKSNYVGSGFSKYCENLNYPNVGEKLTVGDFNGDGNTDCYATNEDNPSLYLINIDRATPQLVTSIKNGFGEKITINYSPLTDDKVYNKSSKNYLYPIRQVQAPIFVVSSINVDNSLLGVNTTKYNYEGLKAHMGGKGLLGFDKVIITDVQKNTSTISNYGYDESSFATYCTDVVTKLGSDIKSEVKYKNVVKKDVHGVIFQYVSESTQKEWDLNGALKTDNKTTTIYNDVTGDVNSIELIQGVSNNYFITKTVNTYSNNISKWYLGRLTRVEVTKRMRGQNPITNVSAFKYDANSGLQTEEIVEPDKPEFKVTKTFLHDAYGNMTQSKTTAEGLPSIIVRSEFDNKGRFEIRSYDTDGNLVVKEYNEHDGSVSKVIDINGLKTEYIYDGFGDLVKTNNADGTYSVTEKRWVMDDDLDAPREIYRRAVFYTYVEKSGAPAVISYFDRYQRLIRKVSKGFEGKKIFIDTHYNSRGLVSKVSNARFDLETPVYTKYEYDAFDRAVKEILPDNTSSETEYNGLQTALIDPLGYKTVRTYDVLGNIIKSTDADNNSVTYSYNSQSLCTMVVDPLGNETLCEFDHLGKRVKITDPDMGTSIYKYNAYGQLVKQVDGNGNIVEFTYNNRGQIITRKEKEGITNYEYSINAPHIGMLIKEEGPNDIKYEYSYDGLCRLINKKEVLQDRSFTTSFSYDSFGRIVETIYPTGFATYNIYDKQGILIAVKDNKGKTHWSLNDITARGEISKYTLGNGTSTNQNFSVERGWMSQVAVTKGSNVITNYEYLYNKMGNLTSRTDHKHGGLTESFKYDNLHRLTQSKVGNYDAVTMKYDEIGNITFKSDVGNYVYGAKGRMPHAVSSIENYTGNGSFDSMDIEYSSFHKVNKITEGNKILNIVYGPNHARKIAVQNDGFSKQVKRYYVGSLFEQEVSDGEIKNIHYIIGGSGCVAVYTETPDDTEKPIELKYLHKDHIGSICATSDAKGNILEEYSYDAWGKRRDAESWEALGTGMNFIEKRGFTGHEHLDLFDLVNMNGRIYDPVIGRFLSPDPFVQMPDYTQGLNRYSYCLNNPLNLTDPSGYNFDSIIKNVFVAAVAITVTVATAGTGTGLGVALMSGFAGGFAGGFTGAMISGGNFGQALKAGVIGGLVGAATAGAAKGIGKIMSPKLDVAKVNKFRLSRELIRASMHGAVNGSANVIQGGNFGSGFLAGSFSSFAGSGLQASGISGKGTLVVSSAVVGGTTSVLGGGKFANGAVTGAFTMWFNHLNGGEGHPEKGDQGNSGLALADAINSMPPMLSWPIPMINPLYGAGAIAIDIGVNLVGAEVDKGIILMLRGKDKGKYITYTEIAGGGGTGGSGGIEVVRIDYTGGNNNINLSMMKGYRTKMYLGGSLFGSVGVGFAWSRIGKNYVIGTSVSLGGGFAPLFGVDAGLNYGEVTLDK